MSLSSVNPSGNLGSLLKSIGLFRAILLLTLLTVTVIIYLNLREQERKFAQAAFNAKVSSLEKTINLRMRNYEQMLLGVAGLYEASKSVERNEFQAYVSRLHIDRNYIGVQGVGYALWIQPQDLPKKIAELHREGFPDFKLRPEGARDHYSAIIFLEPFTGRNLAAFGYDMYSETVRRTAMNYAVVKNTTSLSAKVTLVQEIDGVVQAGMLMYHPVYHKDRPLQTEQQRWQALHGFAYSPFRMNDLMAAIVNERDADINFKIYASYSVVPDKKIYGTTVKDPHYKPHFSQNLVMNLYGQVWTLAISSTSQFDEEHSTVFDTIVLVLGAMSTLLLFFLLCAMASQRHSASLLAQSMSEDVHEKNRLLRQSEERFQLALESSSMGVWSWNIVDNVFNWDSSMYAIFGAVEPVLLSDYESFLAHLHPNDRDRVLQEITAAIEGHKGYETEFRVVWPDHSTHYIACRAKIIVDEYQVPTSMIGMCWDITESKRLEKLKTEFVSTVSHELRTPLTAIIGALGLAVSGAVGSLPDKTQRVLDIAYKNSQRLKVLINDLLDMDKMLAGNLDFDCEVQPLWLLVERAVTENKTYAEQFKVSYLVEPIDPTFKIYVHDIRFLQVMANLLSNAAKFSPENAKVFISAIASDGWVRVAVMDKGVGLSEEAQKHMFEKFYQADSSDKRSKGGTGLGLFITKEIVERMKGRVGFTSTLGVGSTFYVEFQLVNS